MMKLCEIVLNQLHTSAQLLHQLLSTNNMSKRTHSDIVAPTAAVESPKKRGRPCKKLDPLPKEVMKALGILNNYVEKQQAQAQAASDSDVAAIPSAEETPPVKRKGGSKKAEVAKKKEKATIEERCEAIEERCEALSEKLVPDSGPADTVEGEILSAVNRILYRCLNDGDHFAVGYGAKTAGPSMEYLTESDSIPGGVRESFRDWACRYQHEDYSEERARYQLMSIAVNYIEGKESKDHVKNYTSLHDYENGTWTIEDSDSEEDD